VDRIAALSLFAAAAVAGCGVPADDPFLRGAGEERLELPGADVGSSPALRAIVRDFRAEHPDFEAFSGVVPTPGLVLDELDAGGLPVHAADGPTDQTSGPEAFAQWYRDVPGVNQTLVVALPLHQDEEGAWVFDDASFFPIDGRGISDEVHGHNFHFTTAIHTEFVYAGGERFDFVGDDDLWLFVEGRLVLDLGGLHEACAGAVELDEVAWDLGLEVGGTYAMDIFHAERHTTESSFRLETTIRPLLVAD